MFAADAAMKIASRASAERNRHIHKFAHAVGIETSERIEFVNSCAIVCGKELTGVVAAETESHLSKVVRAEAEEFRFFSDFVGG